MLQDGTPTSIPDKQRRQRRLAMGMLLAGVFLLASAFVWHYFSEEQKARRAVVAHLEAIKTGKGNPYETSDVLEIFVNVLDYKYLNTLRAEEVPDPPSTRDRDDYERTFAGTGLFQSYENYLEWVLETYGDRAFRDGDRVIVLSDKTHYEFAFLYDVEVTNRIGHRLYKKFVFEVHPSRLNRYGYVIVDYYEW